jgi:hypothetical protein
VHAGHLADSAVDFLDYNGDVTKLQKRRKQQQKLDSRLKAAKKKLVEFENLIAPSEVPIESLLQ